MLILLTILNDEFGIEIDKQTRMKLIMRLFEEEEKRFKLLIEDIEELLRDLDGHDFGR